MVAAFQGVEFKVGDRVTDGHRSGTLKQIIQLVKGRKVAGVDWDSGNRSDVRLYSLKLIDPAIAQPAQPTSETVSEVEEVALASTAAPSGYLKEIAPGSVEQLFAEINALDAQGLEAEQTAIAAGRAALEIRREEGRKLQEAKDQVVATEGYGSWGKRFAEACPNIHIRTATNYMRLHREWEAIASQAGERLTELTLREAIAILQNKPVLQAAPDLEPEPELTFEQVQATFTPWGELERTKDPKFKYGFNILGKSYAFRGLREAMRWHEENCYDWNTLEARAKQQAELNQSKTCVACQHRQLIGDGSEFHCEARGSDHGVRQNLAPECRHYKPYLMQIPGREQAIALCDPISNMPATPCGQREAIAQPTSETVSEVTEVEAELDAFVESMAPSQPHPAGVLASSARSGDDAEKDERYTPDYVWKAALKVAGAEAFDLDPATNDRQNPHVPCQVAYTILEDGLRQDWSAKTVWLNPPYSKMDQFTAKYLESWDNERFAEGFFLSKGDFSTQWCQKLLRSCTAVCLINHRLTFEAPERELSTSFFASLLFYHGPDLQVFQAAFEELGTVMVMAGGYQVPVAEGRAGLLDLAESIALQEQRYAELVEECLQVGDRILLHASLGQANWQYEVTEFDGETVRAIGPFGDGLKSSPLKVKVDISQVRRIVSGGEA